MKIKTTKHNKKIILISVIVVLALALIAGIFVWQNRQNEDEDSQENNITTERAESDIDMLEDIEEDEENKNRAPNTDGQAPITTDEETGAQRVVMVSSHDIDGSTVNIRGGLNSVVSGGTCSAILTGPNGQTIERNTELLPGPSSVDCRTVSINRSELSAGTWTYKLRYSGENILGESDENTFEIR